MNYTNNQYLIYKCYLALTNSRVKLVIIIFLILVFSLGLVSLYYRGLSGNSVITKSREKAGIILVVIAMIGMGLFFVTYKGIKKVAISPQSIVKTNVKDIKIGKITNIQSDGSIYHYMIEIDPYKKIYYTGKRMDIGDETNQGKIVDVKSKNKNLYIVKSSKKNKGISNITVNSDSKAESINMNKILLPYSGTTLNQDVLLYGNIGSQVEIISNQYKYRYKNHNQFRIYDQDKKVTYLNNAKINSVVKLND